MNKKTRAVAILLVGDDLIARCVDDHSLFIKSSAAALNNPQRKARGVPLDPVHCGFAACSSSSLKLAMKSFLGRV